jgi:hypothetical protein
LEDILTVRIGCGTGFWGDDIDAPLRLVEGADLDYLVMDFLAEVTMSILKKAQLRNSQMGYATDVVPIIAGLIDTAVRKNTRVLSNAGGVNPAACAEAVAQAAKEKGSDIRVAWITGDDVLEQLDVIAQSLSLANIDDGREFATVRDQVLSANVYLGAGPLVEGLRGGAQVVLCGRSTDTALVLAPLIAEYGWAEDDWDRRAAGIVAGHLIECSGQVTGGMHQAGWQEVPGIDLVGYPIVEVEEDGTFVVTKPEGTGGLVNIETVTEQLIYEIQDPRAFQTPDVTCDFTTLRLEQVGPDRVSAGDIQGVDHLRRRLDYDHAVAVRRAGPRGQGRGNAAPDAGHHRAARPADRRDPDRHLRDRRNHGPEGLEADCAADRGTCPVGRPQLFQE